MTELRKMTSTPDGTVLQAECLLGSGTQGEVWRARLESTPVAVKVYYSHIANATQRRSIERLIGEGAPSHYFLWPMSMVDCEPGDTFGYVMELREQRFRPMEDLMTRRVDCGFRTILTAAWQLADAFLQLHSRGLCYRDINFGNVFFDPATGDIRVCDNDNVGLPGSRGAGVYGTQGFMAPEIVRREALPSDDTDRYSLAVLLFYMLMGGHPLEGELEARIKCLDAPARERLYASAPVYIFDPTNSSNRPRPGVQDNPIALHHLYPPSLRDLFEQSFTDGLSQPHARIRESQWRDSFAYSLDLLSLCSRCSAETFYDANKLLSAEPHKCWSCKKPLGFPPEC